VAPVASSACKYAFFNYLPFMTVVDAHHVAPMMGGMLLAVALFFFLKRRVGLEAAAIAAVALALYPRWWAHCHFNPKDVLSTLFISLTIFAFVRAVETRRWQSYAVSALFCGLAVSTKANSLFLPFIVLPFLAASLVKRKQREERVFEWREITCWATYPLLSLLTAFACWPLMWMNFPTNIVKYWSSLVERGYTGTATWSATPLKYAFATMPVMMIVLMTIGVVWISLGKSRLSPLHILLLTWMIIPVLRVCLPGAKDFDGIRHWLEVLPPAAAAMGLGGAWCMGRLRVLAKKRSMNDGARLTLFAVFLALCFLPQLVWMIGNHPHQLTFFNPLVGRLSGARAKGYPEATDYWGSSYRQGVNWLNERADEQPIVTLEVAEHLAFYYFDCIIEEGITVRPVALMEETRAAYPDRPYYLMTIVRPEWQKGITKQYHDRPIVHRITVDGADILQIRRIDNAEKLDR
jgi:hypothetical protein